MNNKKISPGQIPHLVRLTADLFRNMREEIKSPNDNPANLRDESTHMHFVADLLSDLVGIAYPEKESNSKHNPSNDGMDTLIDGLNLKPINEAVIKDMEKDFQNIAKIIKDYKPPKAGEF